MDNCLYGECVEGGSCDDHCQKYIPELDSRSCGGCGHNVSQHVVIAIRVMFEGYRFLSEADVDLPVAEPIATANVTPSVKAAAGQ